MATRLQLVALLVSLALVGGGILSFGFVADRDYTYRFDDEVTETPESVPPLYSELPESERGYVDRALAGEVLRFEESPGRLPQLVERDGSYYAFDYEAHNDYTDPATLVPLGSILVGLVALVATIRWEVTSRYVTY